MPFTWERVWYSTSTYRGPLGHGWLHRYDAALYVAADVVLYRTPDGRLVSLPVLARGEEHFDRVERRTLIHEPSGSAIRTADRSLNRFRDIGRPDDEHVLSSISDPSGNLIRLDYDDRGLLTEIVDTAGRTVELTHDAVGRITAMTAPHPEGQGRRFTVLQYAYDDQDNLSQAVDALHQPFRYHYKRHLLAQETDRNGLSFRFEYDGVDETARCVRTWGDDGIYDHRLSYELERNLTTVVNSLGFKTQYQHRGGLVVRTVDAIGATTLTEYDEHNQKVREIDALGHGARFAYDERGNVVEIQKPDGATLGLQYGAHDQLLQATDAIGGVWRWQYDDKARLASRVDPLGHATRFAYVRNQLRTLTDPAGHATQVDYDAENNPLALLAPDGTMRHWEYDALGRVIAVTDANRNVQQRAHDLLGRPIRIDEPDGNTRRLAYDPEGNVVHLKDAQHDVHFSYQGMGRLASRSEAGTTVRFAYDTEEQLIAITNEHGHVYRFELGPTGEVLAEHGFDGIRRVYQRDRAGRVSATKALTSTAAPITDTWTDPANPFAAEGGGCQFFVPEKSVMKANP
jgi:YD repeat-containing protein